eukprot:819703-Amphidinium_carterae.1
MGDAVMNQKAAHHIRSVFWECTLNYAQFEQTCSSASGVLQQWYRWICHPNRIKLQSVGESTKFHCTTCEQ